MSGKVGKLWPENVDNFGSLTILTSDKLDISPFSSGFAPLFFPRSVS
jgi:hypothetical protein